jgi:hypothetical protein
MIEAQCHYILALIDIERQRKARAVEVTREAVDQFNSALQNELADLVFGTGCSSWYKTSDGHVTANWSGSVDDYRNRTATPNLADFVFA